MQEIRFNMLHDLQKNINGGNYFCHSCPGIVDVYVTPSVIMLQLTGHLSCQFDQSYDLINLMIFFMETVSCISNSELLI